MSDPKPHPPRLYESQYEDALELFGGDEPRRSEEEVDVRDSQSKIWLLLRQTTLSGRSVLAYYVIKPSISFW
jgi:hypothetical protein